MLYISPVVQLTLLLALCLMGVQARIEFTKFYSDPVQMLMEKPVNLDDLRYQRIKNLRDEKWKRRRAAPRSPIRITPFYYSMNPMDMLENSMARSSVMNPFYSSYGGRK